MYRFAAAVAVSAFALPSFAQEVPGSTTIQVVESEDYGEYLTNAEGRPVYLFSTDTQGTGDEEAGISCVSEDCLTAWPLVTTEGDPQAGEDADASLLEVTEDYPNERVVTYNGWPLYYFARDEGTNEPQGHGIQSFGGEWYLVTPAGEEVQAEE